MARNEHEERIAWLALRLIPDLGNRSVLRLIGHFGSPLAALKANLRELLAVPDLREKAAMALAGKRFMRSPDIEWQTLQKEGIKLLTIKDDDYPSNLSLIPDPPAVLFLKGTLEPRDLVSVAVVGSRAASPMGMAFTERLCGDLARYGVTVVSGFAVGIDSAAHRGTLKAKGRTLGVLGCGLDIEYPRGNASLRDEVIQSGGLLTEFPLATPPAAGHFPLRNRIISGLALGVVVVEAADRSGSLITARLALEQGREVFAVPGIARHFRSTGPHRLLKQGAKLAECAEDIMEEIRPLIRPSRNLPGKISRHASVGSSSADSAAARPAPSQSLPPVQLSFEETTLMGALDATPQHIDEISRRIQWPVSRVMATLLALELKGMIQQLPGKYFTSSQQSSG